MAAPKTELAAERKRQQRLSNGRQLAAAGFVDHAVKQYVEADEPCLAAELLASKGRVADATQLLARHDRRDAVLMLAAFKARRDDEAGAAQMLAKLGSLSDEEALRYGELAMKPPSMAPGRARPSSSKPPTAKPSSSKPPAPKPSSSVPPNVQAARSARPERSTPPASVQPARSSDDGLAERAAKAARARQAALAHAPAARGSAAPELEELDEDDDLGIEIDVEEPTQPRARSLSSRPRPNGLRPPSKPSHEAVSSLPPRRSGIYNSIGDSQPPSDAAIDSNIAQLLESGRMDAAAKVAQAAGRHYKAAAWFEQIGDHFGAGSSLSRIGWHQEALDALVKVSFDHGDYRQACRILCHSAAEVGRLDDVVLAQLGPYIDSGPRSDQEIGSFLDLAELLWKGSDRRRAYRCLQSVLRLDPKNAAAELMQLTWAAEAEREDDTP